MKFLKKIRFVHPLGCMFDNSAVLNLLLQVTLTTQETELKQKVRRVCYFYVIFRDIRIVCFFKFSYT